jgi:predicted NodU family carbamoyl transferase
MARTSFALSINDGHDAGAALAKDGKIIAASARACLAYFRKETNDMVEQENGR